MEDTIELNVFLNKLVAALVKKFEATDAKVRDMKIQIDSLKQVESSVRDIRTQIETLKQTNNSNVIKSLDDKVRNIENALNSLKGKSQIDTSILKLIESDDQRKVM